MTEEQFDFWQDHSIKYLEMAFKTDRMEPLEHPDGEGRHTGVCGDTVAMSLKLRGEMVEQVAFEVQGCMNTEFLSGAGVRTAPRKAPGSVGRHSACARSGPRSASSGSRP